MDDLVSRRLVGWREHIDLPQWNVTKLRVKVDSGARTSAMHAVDMVIEERGGEEWAIFQLATESREIGPNVGLIPVEAQIIDHRDVKDSGGHVTNRPIIRTRMVLAGLQRDIEVSLTKREQMGFSMLIGREALRGVFVCDPALSFVGSESHDAQSLRPWSLEEWRQRRNGRQRA